jgi:hypothetical protein
MRAPWIITILLPLILTVGCERSVSQDNAADQGLTTLKGLVEPRNATKLGFKTAADVRSAQLLKPPISVADIDLAALKAYTPAQDPRSVLADSQDVVYPVTVGGAVRSSIVVSPGKRGFSAVFFGDADAIQQFGRYRNPSPQAKDSLVRVPAMGLEFLRRDVEGQIYLTPLNGFPGTTMKVGHPVPAAALLHELAPIAARYTNAAS